MRGVSFSYRTLCRRHRVITDLTWAPPPGRTLLLGPNGAGKSTLLSLMSGILRPEVGAVVGDPRQAGFMPQTVRGVPGLTVRDQVAYCGWLAGLSHAQADRRARVALDRVGLGDKASRPSVSLSGGETRRLGIAEALMSGSRVLLLDEPSAGLDPAQRQSLSALIAGLDASVIVATHQIDDLAETYQWVAVMLGGALVFTGSVDEFSRHDDSGRRDPYAAYRSLTTTDTAFGVGA